VVYLLQQVRAIARRTETLPAEKFSHMPAAAILVGLLFLGGASLLLIPVKPRVEPPGDLQLELEGAAPAAR